jgi:methylenetetrahydrofolate reductase (NADPH)
MRIPDLLRSVSKPAFSVEILPKVGESATDTLKQYESLFARKPLFVDIPFHPLKLSTFSGQNPTIPTAIPTKEEFCNLLRQQYQLTPLPHQICRGFSRAETEKALVGFKTLGVENILVLRGDLQQEKRGLHPDQHKFAFQLVEQIKAFNERRKPQEATGDFCIGIAGYPEPTRETPDMELSIQYLKQKVAFGAEFIQTQLFFDNERFFAFEKTCREAGITVPIIPGICPLTTFKLLKLLPDFFQVSLPEKLRDRIEEATTETQLAEIGTEWAICQAQELYHRNTECVHFFSLAEPAVIEEVVRVVL